MGIFHCQVNNFKNLVFALAGVAQWIECQPVNQRVTSSIPNQGTCLACREGESPVGGTQEATTC